MHHHLFHIIRLVREEYHTAVVTTASRKNTEEILSAFQVRGLFDHVLCAEDITSVKPEPEGFLKVMSHFGADAKHTVIIEDSDVGIEAASKTGASVLVINSF